MIAAAPPPYRMLRDARPLAAIETWIFDLDNTLYPASCHLFDQVRERMNRYIVERLGLSADEASERRRAYFRDYGTTLRGLMTVDGIDPHEFLAYVHDIDCSGVPPDPALVAALARLPGRKLVHTNGSVAHAENVLGHLGLAPAFGGIIDIVAAGFEPKPALPGYHELLRRHGVDPARALMIEDIARNLVPAAALGMTTAWLRNGVDWAAEDSDGGHIDYVVDDLVGFLAAAAPAGGTR
jgi:putative hydrolase of the HAD superfamily